MNKIMQENIKSVNKNNLIKLDLGNTKLSELKIDQKND